MKPTLLTVVGTRPEVIRLSRTIPLLDTHFEHILVHTGQNYDYHLNEVFFKELGIRQPDHFLNCVSSGSSTIAISSILASTDKLLASINPDAFLVLGDTNSGLSAIAAKKRHIPIFHISVSDDIPFASAFIIIEARPS